MDQVQIEAAVHVQLEPAVPIHMGPEQRRQRPTNSPFERVRLRVELLEEALGIGVAQAGYGAADGA
jgi:hypothetical protein